MQTIPQADIAPVAHPERVGRTRTRWAAVGAAVAITLGAGGLSIVDAGSGDSSAFVPIDSCRRFDTRPEFQVGEFDTPFGPDETRDFQITGEHGNCTDIPDDAVSVVIGLGVVGGSQPSNLKAFSADVDVVPVVSNVNWLNGDPSTGLAVVTLSESGAIRVNNAFGVAHAFGDIQGYFVSIDDLAAQVAELSSKIDQIQFLPDEVEILGEQLGQVSNRVTALEDSQPFTMSSANGNSITFGGTPVAVIAVPLGPVPVDGTVTVSATTKITNTSPAQPDEEELVTCSISSENAIDLTAELPYSRPSEPGLDVDGGDQASLSGTRTFAVSAGDSPVFRLMCLSNGANESAVATDRHVSAVFTPTPQP